MNMIVKGEKLKKKVLNSIHPDDDLHYQKMGLKKREVEIWEDGTVWELMCFGKANKDKEYKRK